MLRTVQSLKNRERAPEPLARLLNVALVLRQEAIHPIQFGGDGVYRGERGKINRRSGKNVASFRVASFRDDTFGERHAYRYGCRMSRTVRALAGRSGALQRGNGIVQFSFARIGIAERLPDGGRAVRFGRGARVRLQIR